MREAVLLGAVLVAACGDGPADPTGGALQLSTAPSAVAGTMMPLVVQPIVRLADGGGNPVASSGVTVTATVASGDGIITAGATAVTDATGTATFQSLTIGAANAQGGTIGLSFGAPGFAAVSATVELSCALTPFTLGSSIVNDLVNGDCTRAEGTTIGSRFKEYEVAVSAATKAILVADTAQGFRAVALTRGPNQPSHFLGRSAAVAGSGLVFKVLVPPGTQRVIATASDTTRRGPFKLTILEVPEDEPGVCFAHFHAPLSTTQTLSTACPGTTHQFAFVLGNLETVSATVTTSAFSPRIEIWRESPAEPLASATGTSTASVNWANTSGANVIHSIRVTRTSGVGTYTLQATISGQ